MSASTTPTNHQSHFAYLLVALISVMLLAALVWDFPDLLSPLTVELAHGGCLLLAAMSLLGTRRWFSIAVGLALLNVFESLVVEYLGLPKTPPLHFGSMGLFWLVGLVYAGNRVLEPGPVDANRVIGSICVYLIIGVVWGIFYLLIELIHPGALQGSGIEPGETRFQVFLYFSFVTLTTLGYGDITPASALAGNLVILQAVLGQFYIAVVVAELVSKHLSYSKHHHGD